MSTVTIGRSYLEALLRRAEFHTSSQDFDFGPSLSNNVTISKAEHEYLLQATREYTLLRSALFRGGLTNETLATLLEGESGTTNGTTFYDYHTEQTFAKPRTTPVSLRAPRQSSSSEDTTFGHGLPPSGQPRVHRVVSYDQPESSIDSPPSNDDHDQELTQRVPLHDQRTVHITNLPEGATHKDVAGIICGGRLLDLFLRNDRSATVSFIEGAAEFLAHTKRTDIYLHTKRLEFRWADRQFHVPSHVSNKIAAGATRNLVVRGATGKITAEQIRDHLDHIHNLVVVEVTFRGADAYISTNSIHNALFARTCMMSRTVYKGLRIDYYLDECSAPIPRHPRAQHSVAAPVTKPKPMANIYALLDPGVVDSDSDTDSYLTEGVRVDQRHWAEAAVA